MELSIYDIIVGPITSQKAYRLHQEMQKLMLEIHPHANKPLVAEALLKLFNVKVESVRIMVRKGKRRISRTRNHSVDNLRKIAIVTLKKGQETTFFGNAPMQDSSYTQQSQSATVE